MTIDSSKVAILIVKSNAEYGYASFKYENIQIISNAGWIGIVIGGSFAYFLLLLTSIVFMTKWIARRRLREMQSPNIVYFLKKKVI